MQLHVRMAPRDPHEPHRVATPLELFLDLAFVVAVAQAANSLHHGLVEDHLDDVFIGYPVVFFAIWWAWVNFAWFASAYDTDDALYRLAVFVQMAGVLVLAAGIPRGFDERDATVMVVGYVIMRLALVGQWLRAAASDPPRRSTALRFAVGITVVQAGWLLGILLPEGWFVPAFLLLATAELLVPIWAESAARTTWHPHHIVERYGLFTIIVLGESVLGATFAVQAALDDDAAFGDLAGVVLGGLLIVFSMWWIYFDLPSERLVEAAKSTTRGGAAYAWGYGHYVIFAAAAAVGAGVAVAIDQVTHHSMLSDRAAGLAVTVPVVIYVLAVWALHYRNKPPGPMRSVVPPVACGLVLLTTLTPEPVLLTGLVLAAVVALSVAMTPDATEAALSRAESP